MVLTAVDRAWLRACRRYREDLRDDEVERNSEGDLLSGPTRERFSDEPDEYPGS